MNTLSEEKQQTPSNRDSRRDFYHDQLFMDTQPDPDGVLSIRQLAEQSIQMREENKRIAAQQERNEDVYARLQETAMFHDPVSLAAQTEGPLEVMTGETVITRGSTQQQQPQTDGHVKADSTPQTTEAGSEHSNTGITILLVAAIISAGILVYAQYRRR